MLDLLIQAVRSLLGAIDEAVYGVISSVYKLMIEIASQQVFQSETLQTFGKRVYALVGIFMLFKLAFSLVRYIVNPDEMKDSKKGGKKLIVNVMVVVVLITITPTIFEQSRNLQRIILQENVIGNLILGISGENNNVANQAAKDWQLGSNSSNQNNDENNAEELPEGGTVNPSMVVTRQYDLLNKTVGDQIAILTFNAFYFPKYGDCSQEIAATKQMALESTPTSEADIKIASITDTCSKGFSDETIASTYVKGMAFDDIETIIFQNALINDQVSIDGDKKFSMKYMVLISTIAGIVLLLIFINFCIEVAVRTIKLGFLELMAPIPIISYIDPKSAESGLFSKWLKMCVTTYLSLFIRLAAIYFAIFVIGEVTSGGIDLTSSPLVTVFLILGALIFANQLPKMIEELVPSLKGSGTFSLNPMKTIGASPLATAAVAAPAAALGSLAANSYAAYKHAERNDQGQLVNRGATFRKAALSGAGGALTGGVRGMTTGLKSGGKETPFKTTTSAITKNSQMRNFNDSKGGFTAGMKARGHDHITNVAGLKYSGGLTDSIKDQINVKQHELQNLQAKEQSSRDNVNREISNQSAQVRTGLKRHFDYAFNKDDQGNITGYLEKTYGDYMLDTARDYGIESGQFSIDQWNAYDIQQKSQHVNTARTNGYIVPESIYNSINESYTEATTSDMASVKIKKEISSLEEQKNFFKSDK